MRNACELWPMRGPNRPTAPGDGFDSDLVRSVDLGFLVGAGEGNRTLMTSLEGWGSAIELRPRARRETSFAAGEYRQRTGNRAGRPNCGPFATSPARRERQAAAGACGAVGYGSAPRDVAQLG